MLSGLNSLFSLLALLAMALQVWAFLDAAVRPAAAFSAADKQTKKFWLILLGVLAVADLAGVGGGILGMVTIIGIIAALVYLLDVRPAVRQYGGRRGTQGPYGPW
ncbi:MAG: DUF2516 family protein [Actinomycetota bacterium]